VFSAGSRLAPYFERASEQRIGEHIDGERDLINEVRHNLAT
jgi:hypothetical protein